MDLGLSKRRVSARSRLIPMNARSKPQDARSGRVLTGLSGAGKTTLGRELWNRLRAAGHPVAFLNGDELRSAIADDLGHSTEVRRRSAMRNARLCRLLAEQGMNVVCTTISLFHGVQRWNRQNIPGHQEIYIQEPTEEPRRRDHKGILTETSNSLALVRRVPDRMTKETFTAEPGTYPSRAVASPEKPMIDARCASTAQASLASSPKLRLAGPAPLGTRLRSRLAMIARSSPQRNWEWLQFRRRKERYFRYLQGGGRQAPRFGNDRTAYIIGLCGSGRNYITYWLLQNIGRRARYMRPGIRLHSGPTSMIYSGHATNKYLSREQEPPEVTDGVLASVGAGHADLIFIYRHPLDSLLTNWVYFRTQLCNGKGVPSTSEAYSDPADLAADLERNFPEFAAFAAADPAFYGGPEEPRFLSLRQFVEETELYLECATLALRLEDFSVDPRPEFAQLAVVMSARVDLRRCLVDPPGTRPYRYREIAALAPQFRSFIAELDSETQRGIARLGYTLGYGWRGTRAR